MFTETFFLFLYENQKKVKFINALGFCGYKKVFENFSRLDIVETNKTQEKTIVVTYNALKNIHIHSKIEKQSTQKSSHSPPPSNTMLDIQITLDKIQSRCE